MQVRLVIPRVPKSPNSLLQRHWRVVQNDKNDWKSKVEDALLEQFVSFSVVRRVAIGTRGKKMVTIAIHSPYQEMDPDNLQSSRKPILDALKHNGLIFDDKREWCESTITWTKCKTKKEMRTEITISPTSGGRGE